MSNDPIYSMHFIGFYKSTRLSNIVERCKLDRHVIVLYEFLLTIVTNNSKRFQRPFGPFSSKWEKYDSETRSGRDMMTRGGNKLLSNFHR